MQYNNILKYLYISLNVSKIANASVFHKHMECQPNRKSSQPGRSGPERSRWACPLRFFFDKTSYFGGLWYILMS